MTDLIRAKTLALAGIFQAASLTDSLAWRGQCDADALNASLESILMLDSDDPAAVFGSDSNVLRVGLQALEQTYARPLRQSQQRPHPRQTDIVRYALALIHIERKLAGNPELRAQLRRRLEMGKTQRLHFDGLNDAAMLRNLGGAYVDTIGTLKFRIQVKGNQKQLQSSGRPEQIRAVLLAGVCAAGLWHRLGGRRWHLIFTRGKILGEIRKISTESI
jgi:high frequency lysogenization protein